MDTHPVAGTRAPGPRRGTGRTAHDALWWVVLHQGALDYTESIRAADDAENAGRRLEASRSGIVARGA